MSSPRFGTGVDRVAGRTALVTGGGDGLGRVIALGLSAAGARLVLVGRNGDKLNHVVEEISGHGGTAVAHPCDTSDPLAVERLRERTTDEAVSILINNAGIAGPVADLVDVGPADWDEVFAVNVRGVYLMCRAFLPPMIERGSGDVINMASVSGKRPLVGRTPYTASKMAVLGLTTTLASEVGPAGVSVNSLSPGPVNGPRMHRNFTLEAERLGVSYDQARSNFVSRAALNRMVEPEEVASAVLSMLHMPGLCGADIDLSAGMMAR